MSNGKKEGFWQNVAIAAESAKALLNALPSLVDSHDWESVKMVLGEELTAAVERHGLVQHWPGHGVDWTPWRFTPAGHFFSQGVTHENIIEDLLGVLNEDPEAEKDWEKVKKALGEDKAAELMTARVTKLGPPDERGFRRRWDGKGGAWTPWNFTEIGGLLREAVSTKGSGLEVNGQTLVGILGPPKPAKPPSFPKYEWVEGVGTLSKEGKWEEPEEDEGNWEKKQDLG